MSRTEEKLYGLAALLYTTRSNGTRVIEAATHEVAMWMVARALGDDEEREAVEGRWRLRGVEAARIRDFNIEATTALACGPIALR